MHNKQLFITLSFLFLLCAVLLLPFEASAHSSVNTHRHRSLAVKARTTQHVQRRTSHNVAQASLQDRWTIHPGFYFGAEFGSSFVDYRKSQFSASQAAQITSIKTSGFSEHLTAGFNFSRIWGAELNVNYIFKPKFNFADGKSEHFRNNIISFLGRASIPFSRRFSIVTKLGVGYVAREGLQHAALGTFLKDNEYFLPVYGLGMDCRLTRGWDATVSWVQAPPRASVKLPATNFVGAGFYYHWR